MTGDTSSSKRGGIIPALPLINKRPVAKGWQNPKNWERLDAEAKRPGVKQHGLTLGPHYAFDTRWGKKNCSLAVFDVDLPDEIKSKVKNKVWSQQEAFEYVTSAAEYNAFFKAYVKTFGIDKISVYTITGSGGVHLYAVIRYTDDEYQRVIEWAQNYLKDTRAARPWPYVFNNSYNLYDPISHVRIGECKCGPGAQVVGPGSIHESGNVYIAHGFAHEDELYDKAPEASLQLFVELLSTFSKELVRQSDEKETATTRLTRKQERTFRMVKERFTTSKDPDVIELCKRISQNIRTEDILRAYNVDLPNTRRSRLGTDMYGPHPIHGSATGVNFHVNLDTGGWFCHRHQVGGDILKLVAVLEGWIDCSDENMPKELYYRTAKSLRERGLLPPAVIMPAESPTSKKTTTSDETNSTTHKVVEIGAISDIKLDNGTSLIVAPPREGKTRWAVEKLVENGEGLYITHRHAIVKHAAKIAGEIGARRGIVITGIDQPGACRTGTKDCAHCPLTQNEKMRGNAYAVGMNLLETCAVVMPENFEDELVCPYLTLHMIEPEADFVFTVVDCIEALTPRSMLVFDEDQTISKFFPQSILIYKSRMPYGNYMTEAPLAKVKVDRIRTSEDKLNAKGMRKAKRDVLSKLNTIADVIASLIEATVTSAQEMKKATEMEDLLEATINKWMPVLNSIQANTDREAMLAETPFEYKELVNTLMSIHGDDPIKIIKCNGYGQEERAYLIAAENQLQMSEKAAEIFYGANKRVIIGQTISENTLAAMEKDPWTKYVLNEFKYSESFVTIRVDNKFNVVKLLEHIGVPKALQGGEFPFLLLTRSKERQENLWRDISLVAPIMARLEGEADVKRLKQFGRGVIFYQNSKISRGVDVADFKLLAVDSAQYALPYLSDEQPDVAAMVTQDETTNSVMRIAPVSPHDTDIRVVVVRKRDAWKIKYLEDTVVDFDTDDYKTEDEQVLAKILTKFNIMLGCSIEKKTSLIEAIKTRGKSIGGVSTTGNRIQYIAMEHGVIEEIHNEEKNDGERGRGITMEWLKKKVKERMEERGTEFDDEIFTEILAKLYSDGVIKMEDRNGIVIVKLRNPPKGPPG